MINELTPGQLKGLATVRNEWLAHGLATGPADRSEAEEGVADAYRAAGLEPPRIVIWVDSPLAGAIAAWMLTTAGGQVWGQVWGQVRDQVGGQVWGQVGGQVRDQVRGQVWGQVGGQVRGQVRDQVRDQVGGQVDRAIWGQHDAGWLSFYDYFRTHCSIKEADRLAGLMRVAKSSGWWWPFTGAVILTERPTTLHRDGQGRLHYETGPALAYPDNFAIWAWHGTRVPQDLIETGWDTATILSERNAEIRRCAIERLGWDQFIQDSGLTQVASCPDPGNPPHNLALYDLPDGMEDLYDAEARILLCVNGTPEADGTRHRFGLPVPAHHTDPVEAAAELYGWPAEAYRRLEIRR